MFIYVLRALKKSEKFSYTFIPILKEILGVIFVLFTMLLAVSKNPLSESDFGISMVGITTIVAIYLLVPRKTNLLWDVIVLTLLASFQLHTYPSLISMFLDDTPINPMPFDF